MAGLPLHDQLSDKTPDQGQAQNHSAEAVVGRALARLEAITESFQETGSISEKTYDDLRHELEAQNVWAAEEYPGEEEVSLLELLQASTIRQKTAPDNPNDTHIHQLIECAFLEQEAHRAINTLWPETRSNDLTPAHIALIETATRGYLSEYGLAELQTLAEGVAQKERLPDYRVSDFLQYGKSEAIPSDPDTEAAFRQALRYLEAITDQVLEAGFLWEKTPADFVHLLDSQNADGRQAAERQSQPYTETTLAQLQALSSRRLLAFKDTGWNIFHYDRVIRFMDGLIQKASATEPETQSPSSPTLRSTGIMLSGHVATAK
jgi:hypothetical protein